MSATETTISALKRNWEMVSNAISGMDEAHMSTRPNEG